MNFDLALVVKLISQKFVGGLADQTILMAKNQTLYPLYFGSVVSLLLCLLLSTTNSKKCERSTWEGNRLFSN